MADVLGAGYPPATSQYLWPVIAAGARAVAGTPGTLARRLAALARRLPVVGPVQAAHRLTYRAEIAPEPARQAAWDAAAAAWAELRQPYPRARALIRAAESGDRAAAAEQLRVAADLATTLGAAPLLTRIDELRRSRAADPRSRFGLSPRELEVLRLVGAGCTNRQIAEELVISVKTADRHVSNILAKLGVGNRVQAATAARQMGDLPDAAGGTNGSG